MPRFLALVLLVAPALRAGAQAAVDTGATPWRAWMFARVGPAKTSLPGSPIFGSLGGGLAASHGSFVGMVRATDNELTDFEDNRPSGERDYAVLAGVRSHGDRLFVVGASGLAQSERPDLRNSSGTLTPERKLGAAFDLSAHADYLVAGLSLGVSGVLGPSSARYVAISFGADLGWFVR